MTPDKIPIHFTTRTGKQASDKLPLPFTRRVGDDPGTKPQPKWVKISGCAAVATAPTLDVTTCLEQRRHIAPSLPAWPRTTRRWWMWCAA